ncbi:MAG: bile acid:sodium symporter family protein [Acidobacteria bacterium]|nr:bile acid:sodium symporter family protein [Acidobacteriota bacterium]
MPTQSDQPNKLLLVAAVASAVVFACSWAAGMQAGIGPGLVGAMALAALYFRKHATLHVFTFTFFILTGTAAAMFWPSLFTEWNGFRLNRLNLPLTQIIMFGMGASLSVRDFTAALKMPKAVLIGIVLQFSIMPTLGWFVGRAFGFDPEVAAGIILIGSCSGGVASNVMVYLARGNVALSVTMTACSTLIAPLMTPLLMENLAGRLVVVDFWAMVLSIINLVIIPIGGGLIANKVLEKRRAVGAFFKTLAPLAVLLAVGVAIATGAVRLMGGASAHDHFGFELLHQGLFLLGLTLLVGWILNVALAGNRESFDRILPIVSMTAICIILTIIAAASRDDLLAIGLLLLLAAFIHNVVGYGLGYGFANLAGLSESDRRTVAFEVGMQNGAMGVGLALDVLKSTAAALGPAIFGTWMNVTGSVLASFWRDRPPKQQSAA